MKYSGFYINLDRSADRRIALEKQLRQNGLDNHYTRFTASNGNSLNFPHSHLKEGEVGCFTSHYQLLKENQHHARPLHIIEDDVLFAPQTGQVLNWAIDNGQLDKYDILYTDVAVPLLNDACHAYKAFYDAVVRPDANGAIASVTFTTINMQELIFGGTSSFLVNPQSIGKLAVLFGQQLAAGAVLPIDLYIRKLCQDGTIRVGCIFPFVTSISPTATTTIKRSADELPALAANMLRHSFFIGCDWGSLVHDAARLLPQPESQDIHRQLMLQLLGYSLLPTYKKC